MLFTTATFLSALAAIPLATGLGINCRGSGACIGSSSTMRNLQAGVTNLIPDDAVFTNGQQIICRRDNQICLFFQNISGTKNKAAVLKGVTDLVNHGCNICGSDPTEPGNDVSKGQLTANFINFNNPTYGFV